ncbi:MAG: helix-turn-helix domain-containing protein [Chryseobacterium sp.]
MTEFRYHPEIPGLKINEDGSEVLLNELSIEVKTDTARKYPFRFFYYKGYLINLAKAILECWVGPSPDPTLTAKHIDGDYNNFHYKNLQWGHFGGNGRYPSKLNPEQRNEILEKIKAGISNAEIAREYGVSRNAIFNFKKKQQK